MHAGTWWRECAAGDELPLLAETVNAAVVLAEEERER